MQDQPKRYQCRHIFTDGHRCGSPCLRGEDLCYYHHTTRRPVANLRDRQNRRSDFNLPLPEDQSAIQLSIGQVLQRIAANQIDPRRAGLLLYGLQIASLNLPKPETHRTQRDKKREEPEIVEEITTHPDLGTLAPINDLNDVANIRPDSAIGLLLQNFSRRKEPNDVVISTEARTSDRAVVSTEARTPDHALVSTEPAGTQEAIISTGAERSGETCFSTTEPEAATLPTLHAAAETLSNPSAINCLLTQRGQL